MSRIALTPNASGTGTLTIAAPNTDTDRTLTLPDATGTVVTADGSGNIATTSITPSSGIYLGGSGSANLLDDYEEGTWTPTFVNGTWTYGARDSFYTKVGNLVLLSGRIVWNARSGSGELKIGSLPFTPLTGLTAGRACGSLGTCDGLDTAGSKQIVLAADGNINQLVLRFINDNASWSAVELQNCNSGGELQFTISYPT